LTPIIPTQEEPTFLQAMEKQPGIGAFPYIVYTYSTQGITPQYWEVNDQIVYMIAAHDQKKLRELTLTIVGLLKRFDESAAEINAYIQSATKPDPDNQGRHCLCSATNTGRTTTSTRRSRASTPAWQGQTRTHRIVR
jgi:hypothetical protein